MPPRDNPDPLQYATTSPDQYAEMVEAVAGGKREEGFLVVLGRQPQLPAPEAINAFAQAIQSDAYTVRQRLSAPTPRVLRREATTEKAREWVAWLRTLGLRAFDMAEQLWAAQQRLLVKSIHESPEGLVLLMADQSREVLPPGDILALVFGEVTDRLVVDRNSKSALMGGDFRDERSTSRIEAESLLDIHRRSTPASPRISQDFFDWTSLFPGRTGQSMVLMRELLTKLRTAAPRASVFDDFGRVEEVLGQSEQILSRSSHFKRNDLRPSYRKFTLETVTQSLKSNRSTFEVYSTLARLDALRGNG